MHSFPQEIIIYFLERFAFGFWGVKSNHQARCDDPWGPAAHVRPVIVNEIEIIRNLKYVVAQHGRAQHVPTVARSSKIISDFLAFGFWGGV
jgi:hypothetical protein